MCTYIPAATMTITSTAVERFFPEGAISSLVLREKKV
jgi:hypothetical protein